MEHQKNYIELVRQAQDGDSDSLERLAEMSRGRLYVYVYRIVLRHDAAQEIVQESMLAMVKFLGKLDGGEGFWPWLRGIASNKIRDHRADKQRHKAVSMSSINEPTDPGQGEQGISRLIADEVRALVLAAMRELTPAQRKVLTMRCYEEMPYSEIGQLMGRSECGGRGTSKLLVSCYFGYDHWRSRGCYGSCERMTRANSTEGSNVSSAYWSLCSLDSQETRDSLNLRLHAGYVDGHVEGYTPGEVVPMKVSITADGTCPYPDDTGPGVFYLPRTSVH